MLCNLVENKEFSAFETFVHSRAFFTSSRIILSGIEIFSSCFSQTDLNRAIPDFNFDTSVGFTGAGAGVGAFLGLLQNLTHRK